MQALRLQSPEHFEFIGLPEPDAPAKGEALVRVHRVGICGTDISAYLGKMPFVTYPRILGHELGVEVVAVGGEVTNLRQGDRCSVEPYINDPTSYASRRGRPNCCERLQVLGVHRDGGMRPLFSLPARKLHVSRELSFEQLALVETLAIGCHAVARSGLSADESCLIIGAGPIGLATLEFVLLSRSASDCARQEPAAAGLRSPRDESRTHAPAVGPDRSAIARAMRRPPARCRDRRDRQQPVDVGCVWAGRARRAAGIRRINGGRGALSPPDVSSAGRDAALLA